MAKLAQDRISCTHGALDGAGGSCDQPQCTESTSHMSWVTVIWSMIAAACLTLAGMHLIIWLEATEGVGQPALLGIGTRHRFDGGMRAMGNGLADDRADHHGDAMDTRADCADSSGSRWIRACLSACRQAVARMDGGRHAPARTRDQFHCFPECHLSGDQADPEVSVSRRAGSHSPWCARSVVVGRCGQSGDAAVVRRRCHAFAVASR